MTPWVTRFIIANVIAFIFQRSLPEPMANFIFVPAYIFFRPWTMITYMFLHADFGHIFFNMLALFFFGPRLELALGGGRFVALYFTSGIVAALLSCVLSPYSAILGASGAVFGVMIGYAMYWPLEPIYIWGVFPIQARWLIVGYTILSLMGGLGGTGGVAHYAHLGGFLGGFLFIWWSRRTSRQANFQQKMQAPPIHKNDIERWSKIRRESLHEVNRAELDRILMKLQTQGAESLNEIERSFLDRFSTE